MTANKGFRLGSKTKVEIEVNDKGETISFDFADPSFIQNAQTMTLEAQRLEEDFKLKGEFLEGLETDKAVDDMLLSDEMLEFGKGMSQYFNGLRNAIDAFLGKGASKKIFGDENYLRMFDDLFEELKPYMDLGAEKQKDSMKQAKAAALKKIPQDNKRSL